MARAKKLPSGNWRVLTSKTIDGKIIRKSFTRSTKKEAELIASKWLEEIDNGHRVNNISLYDAYSKYISLKNEVLSPSTIKAYKSLHKNSMQGIMHININSITVVDIQKEINLLSATHSPKYVRNAYGLLNAVFCLFRPNFNPNPTLPSKTKPSLYIPDDNDIQKLLKAAKGHWMEIPILLAAFGPMRRGEICALTSDDILGCTVTVNKSLVKTPDNRWIVKSPKTYSSYRKIEYPSFVIERIKNIKGKIVVATPSAITDAFPHIIKKAGLPSFRFHDLRHYAVSTLHSINVPDKYIMARGGWATNYTMNNVYNHTLKSKSDQIEQQISSHFDCVFENK